MHLGFAKHRARQHVLTGMLAGLLIAAAPGAFAAENNDLTRNTAPAVQADATTPDQNTAVSLTGQVPLTASSMTAPTAAALVATVPATTTAASTGDLTKSTASSAKSFFSGMAGKAGEVVVSALNMIGVRYRWGGDTPDSGLDCSGFVRYVFQDTLGMSLPRRAEEMSHVGEKVRFDDLKPGDLVFFNTMRRAVSHVGIYIGNNKFVHSPSTGSTIRVDDIESSYWEHRFTGARRLESQFSGSADDLRKRVSATLGGNASNDSNN